MTTPQNAEYQPESRTGTFQDGATTRYRNRGILEMQENVPSALSLGLNPADARTSTFQGQRYVQTSPVGRSAETRQANPQYEETP